MQNSLEPVTADLTVPFRRFGVDNFRISCFIAAGCGPGSSVGIANDYGLDGPGSNPGGDEIFRPSKPALGTNQPPIK